MAYDPQASPIRPLEAGLGSCDYASVRPDVAKRIWLYATNDTAATVEAPSYFDPELLGRGDVILASMNNTVGQTPVGKLYVVSAGKQSGDATNLVALFGSAFG
jgi:hypothetical protein